MIRFKQFLNEELKMAGPNSKTEAQSFINKIYSHSSPNPLNPRERVFQTENNVLIMLEMVPFDGYVHISNMVVLEKKFKMGAGTALLEYITKTADKDGIWLHLLAKPWTKDISKSKLESFYIKHGFKKIKGNNYMIREPKQKK